MGCWQGVGCLRLGGEGDEDSCGGCKGRGGGRGVALEDGRGRGRAVVAALHTTMGMRDLEACVWEGKRKRIRVRLIREKI